MTATITQDFAFVARLPDTIATARLVLRAPNRSDVQAMARLANNKNIFKWLANLPHPYSERDAIDFIDNKARTDLSHAYSILTRDNSFIGVVGLYKDAPASPVELGYWIGEPYWGEGYASEAVSAFLSATAAAGCTSVHAWAISANTASRHILEKLGFRNTSEDIGACGPHKGVAKTFYLREFGR